MKITHGGFQRTVSHRLLNRPRIDPVFHAVGCVAVTELVRHDRDAELASGFLDGPLEIGFVHPVTDFEVCARMEAGVVGGE